jgi:hypothetical protein
MNKTWKRFLSEEADVHSNLALSSSDNKGTLLENMNAQKITILLYDAAGLEKILSSEEFLKKHQGHYGYISALVQTGVFLGMLSFTKNRYEKGICFNAAEVSRSAVFGKWQGKGYGKLLYLLALAKLNGAPMMADRFSVSSEAERVWKSLESDSSIETVPPKTPPFTGEFDDIENPQTFPEIDDCGRHPKEKSSALNKAYISVKKRGLLKLLEERDEKFWALMTRRAETEDVIYYSLKKIANGSEENVSSALFKITYGEGA